MCLFMWFDRVTRMIQSSVYWKVKGQIHTGRGNRHWKVITWSAGLLVHCRPDASYMSDRCHSDVGWCWSRCPTDVASKRGQVWCKMKEGERGTLFSPDPSYQIFSHHLLLITCYTEEHVTTVWGGAVWSTLAAEATCFISLSLSCLALKVASEFLLPSFSCPIFRYCFLNLRWRRGHHVFNMHCLVCFICYSWKDSHKPPAEYAVYMSLEQ